MPSVYVDILGLNTVVHERMVYIYIFGFFCAYCCLKPFLTNTDRLIVTCSKCVFSASF